MPGNFVYFATSGSNVFLCKCSPMLSNSPCLATLFISPCPATLFISPRPAVVFFFVNVHQCCLIRHVRQFRLFRHVQQFRFSLQWSSIPTISIFVLYANVFVQIWKWRTSWILQSGHSRSRHSTPMGPDSASCGTRIEFSAACGRNECAKGTGRSAESTCTAHAATSPTSSPRSRAGWWGGPRWWRCWRWLQRGPTSTPV